MTVRQINLTNKQMIFNSDKMLRLREQYSNTESIDCPAIILLDRNSKLQGERDLLEKILEEVPDNVAEFWKKSLLLEDNGRHKGALFEVKLYNWLKNVCKIDIKPQCHEGNLDFIVSVDGQEIIIEAMASLGKDKNALLDKEIYRMHKTLVQIQLPFIVTVSFKCLKSKLNHKSFNVQVREWLYSENITEYKYREENGNEVICKKKSNPQKKHIVPIVSLTRSISPENLKKKIINKCKQGNKVKKAYVIAAFLDSEHENKETIISAFFGSPGITIDTKSFEAKNFDTDCTGVFYKRDGKGIEKLSGILGFEAIYNEKEQRKKFEPFYIENPMAHFPVKQSIFSVKKAFIPVESNEKDWKMQWINE